MLLCKELCDKFLQSLFEQNVCIQLLRCFNEIVNSIFLGRARQPRRRSCQVLKKNNKIIGRDFFLPQLFFIHLTAFVPRRVDWNCDNCTAFSYHLTFNMESIAASNGDTTSLPPSSASKKLTANRAIGFRRKARKLKEAELASTVTSSEEVKEDVEPRSELTVTISGTNDQDDTSTAANQPTPSGTDNTVTNSNRNFSNKKSKAKRSNKYGKSTKSLELDTNDTDVPTDGSGEDRNVNTSAMVTDTMTASNKQPKPKRAHPRGKRGNVMNKRNEKIESNQPAQIDEEDVADFVNEGPSLPSNKIVPVSDDFIQRVNRTTDSENNGRTLQSQSAAPKTPLHSRVSRMAPVVLPRLFSLPARSINTSDCDLIQPSIDKPVPQESSSKQLTSETPTKKAQDFARELPQMDRDLKRINKRQKRARNRNRNKSGTENAETNENSIDMTAFDSASPQPAASRPLPNHQPAILTYDQWKRLPVSKRYTPVTFKEKLASKLTS